jgi:hypothetical protein
MPAYFVIAFIVLSFVLSLPRHANAQLPASADWAVHASNKYQIFPNLTYLTASNYEAKSTNAATQPARSRH